MSIGGTNKKLKRAQSEKNDEFYTKIEDVFNELIHWKHRLEGKRIIAPCDGEDSAFVKFLLAVKDEWKIKSVDYSSYNIYTGEGVSMFNIDYSKYDICITNPPFSLYNEILDFLPGKVDFILVAPMLNRILKREAKLIHDHKLFLGYGRHLPLSFTNTEVKVNCDWITSFDDFNITTEYIEAKDWKELTITNLQKISTYDYEVVPTKYHPDEKYRAENFHISIKEKNRTIKVRKRRKYI